MSVNIEAKITPKFYFRDINHCEHFDPTPQHTHTPYSCKKCDHAINVIQQTAF